MIEPLEYTFTFTVSHMTPREAQELYNSLIELCQQKTPNVNVAGSIAPNGQIVVPQQSTSASIPLHDPAPKTRRSHGGKL